MRLHRCLASTFLLAPLASAQTLRVWDPPTLQPSQRFGESVDLDRDTAVVGLPGHSSSFLFQGAAQVFERVNGQWRAGQLLEMSGAAGGQFAGRCVALDATAGVIVVGAPGAGLGEVYVFERTAQGWGETARLEQPGPSAGLGDFGAAVAVHGDLIAVGAPTMDGQQPDAGVVYVFERMAGSWSIESS